MELKKQGFKALRIDSRKVPDILIRDYTGKGCNKEMLSYRITDFVSRCRSVVTMDVHEYAMCCIHKQRVKQIPDGIFNYQLKTLVL